MSDSTPQVELTELARAAAWGLVKGGHLDSSGKGKAALLAHIETLEAAARAGIHVDLNGEGIGRIYTRAEVEALA